MAWSLVAVLTTMEGRYIPFEWPSENASDALGHSGFNYSRHGIDNSRASASYRDHPTVAALRLLAEVWLTMPIALLGVVGNVVSLVVLRYHRRLKKLQTVVIQLQALAVVDTLILITILLLRLLIHSVTHATVLCLCLGCLMQQVCHSLHALQLA